MAITHYVATALTGGAAGALDAIDGGILNDEDRAFTTYGNALYFYQLDASSGLAETSPSIIMPDGNAGDKRWILHKIYGAMPDYGELQRSKFIYKDSDEITIQGGWYHITDSTSNKLVTINDIDFVNGSGGSNSDSSNLTNAWHYIYIDYSAIPSNNILTPASFLNHTTAPTWTPSKGGWYGSAVGNLTANDRCIFGIYGNGSSQITKFIHDGNTVWLADRVQTQAGINIVAWGDINALRIPGFATRGLITFMGNVAVAVWYWRTNGQTGATGHLLGYGTMGVEQGENEVITDSSQIIEVMQTGGAATITVWTEGWKFPVGM